MANIHPTSIVDPQVQLADDVQIGPACTIQGPVTIGPGCRLIGHVYLNGPLTLGSDNTLYPYACLGFEAQIVGHQGDTAGIAIGQRNIFREMVVVHGSSRPDCPTKIGNDNFFMSNTHVGHDVVVTDRCTFASGALLAGHARIEANATLGGNSAVHQFGHVGRLSFLGGGVIVTKDVPPFMLCKFDDQVIGLNLVGLRRNGIERAAIDALREAFRILYLTHHSNPVAAGEIEAIAQQGRPGAELLMELVGFIRASKRGICSYIGRTRNKHRIALEEEVRNGSRQS